MHLFLRFDRRDVRRALWLKMNIPMAAPNMRTVVTATTDRVMGELTWPCMMRGSLATRKSATSTNGARTPLMMADHNSALIGIDVEEIERRADHRRQYEYRIKRHRVLEALSSMP